MIEIDAPTETCYDKWPATRIGGQAWTGANVWTELGRAAHERSGNGRPLMVIDTYPGVELSRLKEEIMSALPDFAVIDVEDEAARPTAEIDSMIEQNLTADRVFGFISDHELEEFYDPAAFAELAESIGRSAQPTVILGWGAALTPIEPDLLILADMARWEIQQRRRRGAPNWRCENFEEDSLRKLKRAFFVEWQVADRHKRKLFDTIDYVLDTNSPTSKLITAATFDRGMRAAASGPFRVVPFFDSGVWGGQWMKQVCGLDREADNFAWCFDCVPEENSLLLDVDGTVLELPAIDVVFSMPRELLGVHTFALFGAEFPIRFDMLDTMGGGNLSLQVHPLKDYIRETFGMPYTQDESYYLLDAADDAIVYLGIKSNTDPEEMTAALRRAAAGEESFDAAKYVNTFPARKHDHFSIPAGTVHCSGANSLVLEISATPSIFTFKMWDWDRLGLDGRPRPVHLDHAIANIQWDRDTEWTESNLVNTVTQLSQGDGWREEQTGLHELEFIETRRHWASAAVEHDTRGTVNVLNLVQGEQAVVESPTGSFKPFVVHFAETFIVPADVGTYTIRPYGPSLGATVGTLKAWVRGTAVETGESA